MPNLLDTIRSLLQSQRFAVLTTEGNRIPYPNLIAFAFTEDLGTFVFSSPMKTRKFSNIKSNSRVGLLIDNRSNTGIDLQQACVVTALGSAGEVTPSEKKKLHRLYCARHPDLASFASSPDNVLVKVRVEKYILVRGLADVMELVLGLDE